MIPLYQVDAFTTRPFEGNPAAVCPLDDWLSAGAMQSIAAENNLSETAFTNRREDGSYDLRWFTPTVEVDLCGHATLAAAHILLEADGTITFHTRSGVLYVERTGDTLTLDLPARPVTHRVRDPLVDANLPGSPLAVWEVPRTAPGRLLLAEYATQQEIADLPIPRLQSANVMATAPGEEVDFVSRYFAPLSGIAEDPVTGSAHCTLAPYWAERLGRRSLRAQQISSRGGNLTCTVREDRVLIGGTAVTVLRGAITVDLDVFDLGATPLMPRRG